MTKLVCKEQRSLAATVPIRPEFGRPPNHVLVVLLFYRLKVPQTEPFNGPKVWGVVTNVCY